MRLSSNRNLGPILGADLKIHKFEVNPSACCPHAGRHGLRPKNRTDARIRTNFCKVRAVRLFTA